MNSLDKKRKIINIIKCPVLWACVSIGFVVLCLSLLCFIVNNYPDAIENELFLIGCRVGVLMFGLFEGLYFSISWLIEFGKWIQKKKD